jgi:hypothetical protein
MTIIVALTLIHPILTFLTAKGVLKRKDSWQDDWVELCVIKWKTGTCKVAVNRMRQRPDVCFNKWYTLIIADEKTAESFEARMRWSEYSAHALLVVNMS